MQQEYEEKLRDYIRKNHIKAEQIFFENLVDHKENVLKTIKEKAERFLKMRHRTKCLGILNSIDG